MTHSITAWTHSRGGYPTALQLTKIPLSTTPLHPTEILVRVKAAALNPVDIQLLSFPLLPYVPNAIIPSHKGMGEDFSGIVEQAGSDSAFNPGDEVFGLIFLLPHGSLQEVMRIDTAGTNAVVRKPAEWNWEQAAAVPLVWLTARTMIDKIESYVPSQGGKVAVLGGSSSTGMYAVHLAKQRGYNVVATCSAAKEDFVRSMGADETIDYQKENVPEKLRSFAPDAVLDCVGGTESIGIAKRYVTVVGDKTNRLALGGSLTYLTHPRMILRSLLGMIGLAPSYICINLSFQREWLEEVVRLPREKIVIDSTFKFDQVREAYERLNTGRTMGKVVVRVE
ncbi:NAD(P)-binding protein [Periconia macrospinosa]|uniref:NAD(P)-binding protein n=1 Tax=Periconia macrospinosa TaxID=97972 RepID=A0A2V1DNU3_9PLEO|nr:NAD(P)-binding protein [Periconia macrospinosa]